MTNEGGNAISRGAFNYQALARLAESRPEFAVEGLLSARAIGLVVGDSGLGKTALSMALGVAVSSGTPFLGLPVRQGPVLYCDAESGVHEYVRMLEAVSRFAGLPAPPENFFVWSPNFDPRPPEPDSTPADLIAEQVKRLRPGLVIVDPLRAFWPDAEEGASYAIKMISSLRQLSKDVGCTWVLNHHRRKRNAQYSVGLAKDRHTWFEEAAGSLALVNSSDTRLGVESASGGRGDLVIAGFVRTIGWIGSRTLERSLDEDGEPLGYRVLMGADFLNDHYRRAYEELGERFRYKDAHRALGGSSASNTVEFLKQCQSLGLLKKDGQVHVKVSSVGVDGVAAAAPVNAVIPHSISTLECVGGNGACSNHSSATVAPNGAESGPYHGVDPGLLQTLHGNRT